MQDSGFGKRSSTPLVEDKEKNEEALFGKRSSSVPTNDFDPLGYRGDVSGYDVGYLPTAGDRGIFRAEQQGFLSELGGFANQTIVGELLGGTLEGIGYLLDFQEIAETVKGQNDEWGNWLSDIGKGLREGAKEVTPVYEHDPGGFHPLSFEWWAANGSSIASSISLMLPAVGATRGLAALGKVMGIGTKMGRVMRFAEPIAQATISRHMENMMEASQTWKETYDDALRKTGNEDKARSIASEAAHTSYIANYAMLLQDIPQYMLLSRGIGKSATARSTKTSKGVGDIGSLGVSRRKMATAIGIDMAGEGFEEGYQYVVARESKYLADLRNGLAEDSEFHDRIGQYLKEPEMHTAMFFGAIGAGVMQTAGRGLKQKLFERGVKPGEQSYDDARIDAINTRQASFIQANNAYVESLKTDDPYNAEFTRDQMMAELALKNASLGEIDKMVEDLSILKTAPKEEQADFSPEYIQSIDTIIANTKRIGQLWDASINKHGPKITDSLVRRQFENEQLLAQNGKVSKQMADISLKSLDISKLSADGVLAAELLRTEMGVKGGIQILEKNLEQAKKKEKTDLTKQLKQAKVDLKSIQTEYDKLKPTEEDQKLLYNVVSHDQLNNLVSRKYLNELNIAENSEVMVMLKEDITKKQLAARKEVADYLNEQFENFNELSVADRSKLLTEARNKIQSAKIAEASRESMLKRLESKEKATEQAVKEEAARIKSEREKKKATTKERVKKDLEGTKPETLEELKKETTSEEAQEAIDELVEEHVSPTEVPLTDTELIEQGYIKEYDEGGVQLWKHPETGNVIDITTEETLEQKEKLLKEITDREQEMVEEGLGIITGEDIEIVAPQIEDALERSQETAPDTYEPKTKPETSSTTVLTSGGYYKNEGEFYDKKIVLANGEPIVANPEEEINWDIIASPNLPLGTVVELELVKEGESKWWDEHKEEFKGEEWNQHPIFVVIKESGIRAAKLAGNKEVEGESINLGRKELYRRLQAGEKVEMRTTTKDNQNHRDYSKVVGNANIMTVPRANISITTLQTQWVPKKGNKFELESVPLTILTTKGSQFAEGTKIELDKSNLSDEKMISDLGAVYLEGGPEMSKQGLIYTAFMSPSGIYKALQLHTSFLSDDAVDTAINLLRKGDITELEHILFTDSAIETRDNKFFLQVREGTEGMFILFNDTTSAGKGGKGEVIKIDQEELTKVKGTVYPQKYDEETEKFISSKAISTYPIEQNLRNFLKNKRYNVRKDLINSVGKYKSRVTFDDTYDSYINYLTSSKEHPAGGILLTNAVNKNGSIYQDIQLLLEENIGKPSDITLGEAPLEKEEPADILGPEGDFNTVFSLQFSVSSQAKEDLLRTINSAFLDEQKKIAAEGRVESPLITYERIRNGLLSNAILDAKTGNNLGVDEAKKVYDSIKSFTVPSLKIMQTSKGVRLSKNFFLFRHIYENWNTSEQPYGNLPPEGRGWREEAERQLKEFGHRVRYDDVEAADDPERYEKDHLIGSHLEESMKDKLSGQVKLFLSTIKTDQESYLSTPEKKQYNYLPFNELYSDVLQITTTSRKLEDAIFRLTSSKLEKLRKVGEALRRKSEVSSPEYDPRLMADFYRNMMLVSNEFMGFIEKETYEDDTKTVTVRSYNSNASRPEGRILERWRGNAKDNLFIKGENLEYEVDQRQVQKLETLLPLLEDRAKVIEDLSEVLKRAPVLQEFLEIIGADISQENLELALETGVEADGSYYSGANLYRYIIGIGETYGFSKLVTDLKNGQNIYDVDISILTRPISVQKNFESNTTDSYINEEGKTVYPINMPSTLDRVFEEFKKEGSSFVEMYDKDVWYNPTGNRLYKSIFLDQILEQPEFRRILRKYQFSAYKRKGEIEAKKTFANLNEIDETVLRYNAFVNGAAPNVMHIAFPLFADRSKLLFAVVPRLSMKDSLKHNTYTMGVRAMLMSYFYQDIAKMQREKRTPSTYKNYTENSQQFTLLPFLNKSKTAQQIRKMVEDMTAKQIEVELATDANKNLMGDLQKEINQFIENELTTELARLDNLKINKKSVSPDWRKLYPADKNTDPWREMVRDYVISDIIVKNELRRLIAGDLAFYTDYDNFNKRAATLTTPGMETLELSDLNDSYGDKRTYTTSILKDVFKEDIETLDGLEKIIPTTTEEAAKVIAPYRKEPGNPNRKGANKTDSMGFISLDKHRHKMEGQGTWLDEHEAAYKNYQAGGEFVTPDGIRPLLNPIKTIYDGFHLDVDNRVVRVVDKHVVFPLLREFTKASPAFEKLRLAMEEQGIDEVNMESARKVGLDLSGIKDINDDLSNWKTVELETRFQRIPQIVPENDKPVMMSTQARKHIISNMLSDEVGGKKGQWTQGYILGGKKIGGEELFDLYHNVTEQLVGRSLDDLNKQLGYTKEIVTETPFPNSITQETYYHGSNSPDIKNFDLSLQGKAHEGRGINFALTREDAKVYGTHIYEVKLNISKWVTTDAEAKTKTTYGIKDVDEIVVYHPDQVQIIKEEIKGLEEKEKFYTNLGRVIKRSIEERDLPENYERALNIIKTENDVTFELPLAFPAYQKRFEQIILSLFKKNVINQTINGASLVQIAELGGVQEEKGTKELGFVRNKDGKVIGAEVALPYKLAQKLGITNIEGIPGELRTLVGYRIPGHGKNSMIPLRIVRILPESMGKVILVPGEITTQMGTDFDMDKVFLMMPNAKVEYTTKTGEKWNPMGNFAATLEKQGYKFDSSESHILSRLMHTPESAKDIALEYPEKFKGHFALSVQYALSKLESEKQRLGATNPTITKIEYNTEDLEDNTREGLENLIIDINTSILTNPAHLEEMLESVDSSVLTEAANKLRPKKSKGNPFANVNSPGTEIEMSIRNKAASRGISTYASALKGQTIGQYARSDGGLRLQGNFTVIVDGEKYTKLNRVKDTNGRLITDNLSIRLSAALDNTKDPVLGSINDNEFTTPVINLLLRLGVVNVASSEWEAAANNLAVLLTNQPVILELTTKYLRGDNTPANLKSLIEKLGGRTDRLYNIDTEVLARNIGKEISEAEGQMELLSTFYFLHIAGRKLVEVNRVFSSDTPGTINTIAAIEARDDLIDSVTNGTPVEEREGRKRRNDIITGVEGVLDGRDYPMTSTFNGVINAAKDFSTQFFPFTRDGLTNIKRRMVSHLNKDNLTADQMNLINNDSFLWLMTIEGGPLQGLFTEKKVQELLVGTNSIDIQLQKVKELPAMKDNRLLARLLPHRDNMDRDNRYNTVSVERGYGLSQREQDDLTIAFREILKNSETKEFGKNLIHYTILSKGMTPTVDSIIDLVPIEVWSDPQYSFTQESMADYFRDSMIQFEKEQVFGEPFMEQFIENNAHVKDLVPYGGSYEDTSKSFIAKRGSSKTYLPGLGVTTDWPGAMVAFDRGLNKRVLLKKLNDQGLFKRVKIITDSYKLKNYNIHEDRDNRIIFSLRTNTVATRRRQKGEMNLQTFFNTTDFLSADEDIQLLIDKLREEVDFREGTFEVNTEKVKGERADALAYLRERSMVVREDLGIEEFTLALTHEAVHYATMPLLSRDGQYSAEVVDMLDRVKKADRFPADHQGLSSPEEFITAAYSDRNFQRQLSYIEGKKENTTIWSEFVDLMIKALNTVLGVDISGSVLEELFGKTQEAMNRQEGKIAPESDELRYAVFATRDNQISRQLDVLQKVIDSLKHKLAIYKRQIGEGKSHASLVKLREQLERRLEEVQYKEGILEYTRFANAQAGAVIEDLDEIEAAAGTPREKLVKLEKLLDYASSFGLIEEGFKEMYGEFGEEGLKIDRQYRDKYISPVLKAVQDVQSIYREVALENSVEFLFPYTRDVNLTKEDLRNSLNSIGEDITEGMHRVGAMVSSVDPILALTAKAVERKRAIIAKSMNSFVHGELQKQSEALRKYKKSQGVSEFNYRKFYDFMLIKQDGELTGDYIIPGTSEFKKLAKEEQEFITFFNKFYGSAQEKLPAIYRKGNQLIPILKPTQERLSEGQGPLSVMKHELRLASQITEENTEYAIERRDGQDRPFKLVPVKYVSTVGGENGMDTNAISLDMVSNLVRFMTMSRNYSAMSSIAPDLHAVKYLVGMRTVVDSKGSIKTVTPEGAPAPKQSPINPRTSNAYRRISSYLDMVVYGEYKEFEGDLFGTKINKAKVLDTITRSTALLQLGFNLSAGINNMTIGQFMNSIMTAGGLFYTGADYRWATKEYIKLLPEFMSDTTKRFTESTFGRYMEAYDIYQTFDEFGNPLKEESILKRLNMGASMFMINMGEHTMQTQLALSLAKSHRIEGGKIYSFMDWAEKHNKPMDKANKKVFNELPDVYSSISKKDDGSILVEGGILSKDLYEFAGRIKELYRHLHGNYNKKDTTVWQRTVLGRMSMLFRRWLAPGWDARFGREKFAGKTVFNEAIGANLPGRYVVTKNFLMEVVQDYKRLGGIVAASSKNWNEMPAWRKMFIQQTIKEGVLMLGTLIFVTALSSLEAGDEPEEGTVKRFFWDLAVYQAYRLNSELWFFINPIEAGKILRTPMATISVVEKLGKGIYSMLPAVTFDGIEWQRYEKGDKKGRWKGDKILDVVPLWNQIRGLKHLEERINYMKTF
ncbi:hypothetical protein LCGC14_0246380 [marine sediment metagenome]|uniref:Large polyvalent protein associated domain-containing protein n=1 Tax=marine sediment metagenome TaxID=412755 RepID=A0A0F9UMM7_9ZZZZ